MMNVQLYEESVEVTFAVALVNTIAECTSEDRGSGW